MERITTGNSELDLILGGGLPLNSLNVIAGTPGTGKTILAQQFIFANAHAGAPGLYLTTLSEPTSKVLRYLQEFSFFDDHKLLDEQPSIFYRDIAEVIRSKGMAALPETVTALLNEHRPAYLVIDSFKALRDLASPGPEIRRAIFDRRLRVEWSTLIAHDLRQPLSSIELYAQLVARQAATDPALQGRVQQIRTLVRRLSRMVQDLVDFTRLEARQLTVCCQPVELVGLIQQETERIALEAPERPIRLSVRGAPAWVNADGDRITQVVENLLTNALKYGDPGTPIRVEVEAGAGQVFVSVTNQGPGIAPESMPYLFGRLQRARDAQRRGMKGLGLGLYITRELIEAHHGQITVESVPGETTTFRFTLPLVQQDARFSSPSPHSS